MISHLCFHMEWGKIRLFLFCGRSLWPKPRGGISFVGDGGGDNHGNAPLLPGYQESSLISYWLKSLCYLKLLLSNICLMLSSHKDKAGNIATCCVCIFHLTANPSQISFSLQEQINCICYKDEINFNK